jgi:hypothetical protein
MQHIAISANAHLRCLHEHIGASFSVTTGIDSLPDRIAAGLKDAEL